MIYHVAISSLAKKQIRKFPDRIKKKLIFWIQLVRSHGLEEVRKMPGFHDEPLRGKRQGHRSVRLNRSYRAIYVILEDDAVEFVNIEEVNKHEY